MYIAVVMLANGGTASKEFETKRQAEEWVEKKMRFCSVVGYTIKFA